MSKLSSSTSSLDSNYNDDSDDNSVSITSTPIGTPRNNDVTSLDLSSHYLSGFLYSYIFPPIIQGLKLEKNIDIDEDQLLEWLSIPSTSVVNAKMPINKNSFPSIKKKNVTNRGRKPRTDRKKCAALLVRHPNNGKNCSMYCKAGEIYCPNHCKRYLIKENSKMKTTSPNTQFSPFPIIPSEDINLPKSMSEPLPFPVIPKTQSSKKEKNDIDLPDIPNNF